MIKPAGHEMQQPRKYESDITVNDLVERCLAYVDSINHSDGEAERYIPNEATADAAHAMLLHPLIQRVRASSHVVQFLNALYRYAIPDDIIVFNQHTDYWGIGFDFDRIMISKGIVGDMFGMLSKGVIINCGTAGKHFGFAARGLAINAGTIGDEIPFNNEYVTIDGIAVLNDPVTPLFGSPSRRLEQYILELVEYARNDPYRIVERFGTAQKIIRQVKND